MQSFHLQTCPLQSVADPWQFHKSFIWPTLIPCASQSVTTYMEPLAISVGHLAMCNWPLSNSKNNKQIFLNFFCVGPNLKKKWERSGSCSWYRKILKIFQNASCWISPLCECFLVMIVFEIHTFISYILKVSLIIEVDVVYLGYTGLWSGSGPYV